MADSPKSRKIAEENLESMQPNENNASGYLTNSFEGITKVFTEVEIVASSDTNIVAKAKRYGRWWLLKGLHDEVANELGFQQRLRKELEILMQLQHPGVVTAYGIEDVDGLGQCIVMEYIDGQTLEEWLKGKHARQEKKRVARELAEAVGYIHSKGIVHRDLKPENIIITRNGENVKLIDFGLADSDSHAILKQPAGTLQYMSPEQSQTAVADVRNDIYSLGVVFGQMGLGFAYRAVIKKCLQPIERRYQHIADLQHDIQVREGRIRKSLLAVPMLLVIFLLVLAGMQFLKTRNREMKIDELTATYQKEQAVRRQQMKLVRDSMEVLRADNMQLKEHQQREAMKRQRITDAINKGYALVEKARVQSGVDHYLDTLSNIAYERTDMKKRMLAPNQVASTYLEQIRPDFSDTEMAEITNAIMIRNGKIYEEWGAKFKSKVK